MQLHKNMSKCKYTHCTIYYKCDHNLNQLMYCRYIETLKHIALETNLPKHERQKINEWIKNKIHQKLRKFSTKVLQ